MTHLSTVHSLDLKDRILWFDGDSSIKPNILIDLIAEFGEDIDDIFVTEITDEIKEYNKFVSKDNEIQVKTKLNEVDLEWNIPEEYKKIDVKEYIVDKFQEEIKRLGYNLDELDKMPKEINERALRISKELYLFEQTNSMDVVRSLIFIINTFKENNIVWGMGRGSSVNSYVLYLIEVHDLDSVKFDLDINEFFHIPNYQEMKYAK